MNELYYQVDFSVSEARNRLVDIDTYRIEVLTFMADYAARPHDADGGQAPPPRLG